jgi:hypothetical protein
MYNWYSCKNHIYECFKLIYYVKCEFNLIYLNYSRVIIAKMNLFKIFTLFALIVAIICKKNEYSEENQSCRQYGSGDVYPSNSNLI